jgi:hypothetical protein
MTGALVNENEFWFGTTSRLPLLTSDDGTSAAFIGTTVSAFDTDEVDLDAADEEARDRSRSAEYSVLLIEVG